MKMKDAMTCFEFRDAPVRVVERDGAPWFVAADVCRVLELSNPTEAVRGLEDDEKITLSNPEGNPRAGQPHQFTVVSESGLYALVFKSRKPEAKEFRRWVTGEVLPALRKTGVYAAAAVQPERSALSAKLEGMRSVLLQTMDGVLTGNVSAGTAQSVANTARVILESIKIEGEAVGYESVFQVWSREASGRLLPNEEAGVQRLQTMPQRGLRGAAEGESPIQPTAVRVAAAVEPQESPGGEGAYGTASGAGAADVLQRRAGDSPGM